MINGRKARALKALENANFEEDAYVVIVLDYDGWKKYYYVKKDENINDYLAIEFHNKDLVIDEVYDLSMDIESQLKEERAFHITKHNPEVKKEEKTISNKDNPNSEIMFESKLVQKAYKYAKEKHKGQYRKGKKQLEYITHPVYVAKLINDYKGNSHNIEILQAAALLHDVCEDCNVTYTELIEEFGPEVASLVKELTSDKDMKKLVGKENYLSISMKNMSNWALCIKLCDRLSNIIDLVDTSPEFCEKYVNETLGILNYIADNRKLTKTHLKIISTMLIVLDITIDKLFEYRSKESYAINSLKLKYSKIS